MAYQITGQEYKTLIKNTDMAAMNVKRHGSPIADYQQTDIYSKKTGELRVSAYQNFHEDEAVYTVHSEFLDEETRIPTPELRIRVETFEELQEILNNYAKLRKEQENGN